LDFSAQLSFDFDFFLDDVGDGFNIIVSPVAYFGIFINCRFFQDHFGF